MLKEYFTDVYDLNTSFVIGDRISDVELARNLGCKAIFISDDSEVLDKNNLNAYCALQTKDWNRISEFLLVGECSAEV